MRILVTNDDGITDEEAVACSLATVAIHAIRRAHLSVVAASHITIGNSKRNCDAWACISTPAAIQYSGYSVRTSVGVQLVRQTVSRAARKRHPGL